MNVKEVNMDKNLRFFDQLECAESDIHLSSLY